MRRIAFLTLFAMASLTAAAKDVSIIWAKPTTAPHVTIDRGTLASSASAGATRLDLAVTPVNEASALPVLVTVETAPRAFTFTLSDVSADYPVWLPEDGVIVTDRTETRTYEQIAAAIRRRGGQTKLQQIAAAAETNFDRAAATGRDLKLQTWLGVTRDIRLFRIDENMETFQPKFAGYDTPLPETPKQPATYAFQLGRGWGPRRDTLTRRLDEQVLPILRGEVDDDAIHYDVTMFASLERSPLTAETLRGTDYLVADAFGHGHMFTPAQAEAEKKIHETELNSPEEVVLYARAVAINRGSAPQYALFRTAMPSLATPISPKLPETTYDAAHGLGAFASGRVFAVSKLNGKALPAEEMSVLLRPGETAMFEFFVPHRPVSRERALALAQQSFDHRLGEARMFWRVKLHTAAQWKLPEARIDEMVRAGLLHLDLITYGREPAGTLLPAIGLYTAIGSESAPIIQFMDSMGWHDTAARAIDFFLQKQHDDGFIQNFNGYMLETGAVLWTMGEHYRYTRDDAWLQRVHPHLTKAAAYLIKWRERNMQPELRGKGYGLLDGKTADPEDPYRSYMLNGYAYLGLARAAEMLRTAAPEESARYLAVANALRADIRTALDDALAHSPVVPLGDGTWVRAAPPWTNYRGPVMLHADGGRWFTHWTMTGRDSLLGPLYLVFQEVIGPREPIANELLQVNSELMLRDNVAFSQPYYSRHPWVHLQRCETKEFIQAWYATVAALADRSTYTFSEHFAPASYHKTHEEAWFLMETRWMLYLEDGPTLRLFSGAPRAYFQPGAKLSVQKAGSYFGPLSFDAAVTPEGREIKITVDCPGTRRPGTVEIRVPHPQNLQPTSVSSGEYIADRETVRLSGFDGHAEIVLHY
ncbi:MAG: hypothetical protein JSS11_02830 [Verrucomicrobia bacterium]|nr:hypothetical protein [Verrucomicrobiota bacterium]